MKIQEILEATSGKLVHSANVKSVKGVSLDTRTLKKGELFIALKGKNFDGHSFLKQAIQKGAAACLVSEKNISLPSKITIIQVRNTTEALGKIASHHRQKFSLPIIAITGSVGKTTTKEMVAAILSKRYNVLKNFSTENNLIGVSKTLLRLNASHGIAVLELGTNHFGEIRELTEIVKPSAAILISIGPAHLKYFKNLSGVFKEKTSLLSSMPQNGVVFYNADDAYLSEIAKRSISHKKILVSTHAPAAYQACRINCTKERYTSFCVSKQKFILKALSRSYVINALLAIACGKFFGVDLKSASQALLQWQPPQGRQEIFKLRNTWIINDAYNANPLSVQAALETLQHFPTKGRRFFVFGDMLELGRASKKSHEKIGQMVLKCKIDCLLTLGTQARQAIGIARRKGVAALPCATHQEAASLLKSFLKPEDVVLIKASRSIQAEKILPLLKKRKMLFKVKTL